MDESYVKVICEKCGKKLRCKAEDVGKVTVCPGCNQRATLVPRSQAEPEPVLVREPTDSVQTGRSIDAGQDPLLVRQQDSPGDIWSRGELSGRLAGIHRRASSTLDAIDRWKVSIFLDKLASSCMKLCLRIVVVCSLLGILLGIWCIMSGVFSFDPNPFSAVHTGEGPSFSPRMAELTAKGGMGLFIIVSSALLMALAGIAILLARIEQNTRKSSEQIPGL